MYETVKKRKEVNRSLGRVEEKEEKAQFFMAHLAKAESSNSIPVRKKL